MKIDVDGIHVTLAGTDILEAVDASVDPGALVGLVGPNGAGKTTLLRTITATLAPNEGHVFVGPEDVHNLSSRAASRRLASVPQSTNLDFEFTVREVVEMGRNPHRGRFERAADGDADIVDAALERTDVAHFADRPVTTLSGGERQRVLLARALAQDAPVLVLDEPTASLDVNHQVRTLGLVRDLVDDGRTGIAAIHDLELAARFCDSLILVADGCIHASGPPETVLTTDTLRDAFGARAVVTENPITGTPSITVRHADVESEMEANGGLDARVHVLGGATDAAPYLPALADAASTVTVGPVVAGGQDEAVAIGLDLPVTAAPPLTGLNPGTLATLASQAAAADVLVAPASVATLPATEPLRDRASRVVFPGSDADAATVLAGITDALAQPLPPGELPAN